MLYFRARAHVKQNYNYIRVTTQIYILKIVVWVPATDPEVQVPFPELPDLLRLEG
jgi:hypothetical protein